MAKTERKVALAIGCHPDDIEFMMVGTLILLGEAGYEMHYMNLANGSCGTAVYNREDCIRVRTAEAKNACKIIGAKFHAPLMDDIDVYYEAKRLAKLGAVMRQINPTLMLLPSPQDYMEDHMNTGRLAVSAAFNRPMINFKTIPPTKAVGGNLTLYHALPYGLRDGLRQKIRPGQYVDVTTVIKTKREMLACHKSQKEWLDTSQGLDAYLITMENMCREVGKMSKKFKYAEGWRRHSHLGFSETEIDPLAEALGKKIVVDSAYEKALNVAK